MFTSFMKGKNHRWSLAKTAVFGAVFSAILLPVTSTMAQDQDEAVSGILEEVLITARRYEESINDAPVAVAVMDMNDLNSNRIDRVDDIFNYTPGASYESFSKLQPVASMRGLIAPTPGNASSESSIQMVIDNVVVTRTFSKIYGLPFLRIGWAYCSAGIADLVQRIRTPFNTNGAAMAAATAAVRDTAYIEEIRQYNALWRERIALTLTELGIEVIPSQANFYLLRFAQNSGKNGSDAAVFLQSRGIIPRPAGGSDQFLRITIGLEHENEAVLSALTDYMAAP